MSTCDGKIKLGVLGSGSGSNMQAILDAIDEGSLSAEIVLVLSDNPDAYILERAQKAGIPTEVIDCLGYSTRFPDSSQRAVAEKLKSLGVDLVCLAGFMRLVKQPMLDVFPERILNIHPSLLPKYPGLNTHARAIAAGDAAAGCSVHEVTDELDGGPILGQARVPILSGDTPETLAARILPWEHQLYPAVLRRFAQGDRHPVFLPESA